MVSLCIDGSSGALNVSLGVYDKENKILSYSERKNYSTKVVETIDSSIKSVLEELAIKPSDIDQIYFTLGPGSYTSLRAVYSFIKGFSLQNSNKLIQVNGVSLFLLLLNKSLNKNINSEIKVSIKGNKEEIFSVIFNLEIKKETIKIISISEILIEQVALFSEDSYYTYETIDILSLVNSFILEGSKNDLFSDLILNSGHFFKYNSESEYSIPNSNPLMPNSNPIMYVKGVNALTLKERNKIS